MECAVLELDGTASTTPVTRTVHICSYATPYARLHEYIQIFAFFKYIHTLSHAYAHNGLMTFCIEV